MPDYFVGITTVTLIVDNKLHDLKEVFQSVIIGNSQRYNYNILLLLCIPDNFNPQNSKK